MNSSSETIHNKFFTTVDWLQEQVDPTQKPIVVYSGDHNQTRSKGQVIAWDKLESIVKSS